MVNFGANESFNVAVLICDLICVGYAIVKEINNEHLVLKRQALVSRNCNRTTTLTTQPPTSISSTTTVSKECNYEL